MPTRKNRKQRGGSSSIASWLWGVSNVQSEPTHAAKPQNNGKPNTPQKGAGKKRRYSKKTRGGLSSQLVPFGLTAALLLSRRNKRKNRKAKFTQRRPPVNKL
tara:strand:+ start:640 stop:945 length:306 start_codon:yes stop_codon:yes gene_type:complete